MTDKPEIKVTRTYSLDPAVITWVTQKAARLTMANLEADGKRVSDSEIVNDILTAAMNQDKSEQLKRETLSLPANKRTAKTVAA